MTVSSNMNWEWFFRIEGINVYKKESLWAES